MILRDEEYSGGARITLERDDWPPFAITCGIYGWMVHTCFFPTEEAAQTVYEAMKADLARIADLIPLDSDPDAQRKFAGAKQEIEKFIEQFA